MNSVNEDDNKPKISNSIKILLVAVIVILSTIGIFSSAVFMFVQPGTISYVLFALAIVFLLITPLIIAIFYYVKFLKPQQTEEQKIITLSQKEEEKSRLDLIE